MWRGAVVMAVAAGAVLIMVGSAALIGLVLLASAGGVLAGGCTGDGGTGGGAQEIGGRSWSAEQTANAQTITQAAVRRGLPRRAAVIAVSTAIVESALRNLAYGDRDSLGLFQQRPSQSWGLPRDILNPALAAGKFYDVLVTVQGWSVLPPGVAAQAVQRSAFPQRYAPAEPAAAELVGRYWVGPDDPAGTASADHERAALGTLACPDQGGAELPRGPGPDPAQLPPGFTFPADPVQRDAVTFALAQLRKPYVWGAKGPDAFDCSGLIQAAWAAAGVALSAGTVNQIRDGTPTTSLTDLVPGDLLFIPGSFGSRAVPRHVGMYVGHGVVVDARSARRGVILSSLDDWRGRVVAIRHIAGPRAAAA